MEIKQRRKCGYCRCLTHATRCELGYSVKAETWRGIPVNAVPLEPCPKPLTVQDHRFAYTNYRKNK